MSNLSKIALLTEPTPLQFAAQLSALLDVELWIKRDDLSGDVLTGGNKLRKFEYLFAHVRANAADTVIFTGGAQSNMIRAGITVAHQLGLNAVAAYTCTPDMVVHNANWRINALSGVRTIYIGKLAPEDSAQALHGLADNLRTEGATPYIVPLGASIPLTLAAYIDALDELAAQQPVEYFDYQYVALGSAGTYAGLYVGMANRMLATRLRGVSVLGDKRSALNMTLKLLGDYSQVNTTDMNITDEYLGAGYGSSTPAGMAALRLLLQREGMLLDQVYTAKAFAALLKDVSSGAIARGARVLFWHTGGAIGLFAM